MKLLGRIASALVVVGLLGVGAWAVYRFAPWPSTQDPAEFDAAKAALHHQTHLEPRLVAEERGSGAGKLLVVYFDFVPGQVDKAELERTTREMLRKSLPTYTAVDVRFGDNLRFKPAAAPRKDKLPSPADLGLDTKDE